ncbi:hydroxyphenylacetyl-CoA thioesterase PaaI [Streptosporangium sp. NPDC023615]|uniref:hydroxyphenylacetyl-CoA thioesterase PaaI n=1 Tax=Streptosporangium sp. NPDC023615 TaxID=3154794 RepID=UPI003436F1A7
MSAERDPSPAACEQDPACRALGIAVEEVTVGRARLSMRVSEDMLNGHGIAHGGYLFLLADAAFSYACNSHGPVTLAHSAQVTFLRPAAAGDDLVAEAAERVRYGRGGVYDVTVRHASGEVVAEFRGQSVTVSGTPGRPPR